MCRLELESQPAVNDIWLLLKYSVEQDTLSEQKPTNTLFSCLRTVNLQLCQGQILYFQ